MRYVAVVLMIPFLFVLLHIGTPEFKQKISDLSWVDWITVLYVPLAAAILHFSNRYWKRGKLNSTDFFWIFCLIFTGVFILFYINLIANETPRAIALGAYFGTLGWVSTMVMNTRNQIKAHTMNVLIQWRTSTEFAKQKTAVFARFPLGRRVADVDLAALKSERGSPNGYANGNTPVLESMYYVLNFFEFIAAGVLSGDLNEGLVKTTLRSIMKNWHEHLLPVIKDAKNEEYGHTNDRIFANLNTLVDRWRT